jgi:hypothetical protein
MDPCLTRALCPMNLRLAGHPYLIVQLQKKKIQRPGSIFNMYASLINSLGSAGQHILIVYFGKKNPHVPPLFSHPAPLILF